MNRRFIKPNDWPPYSPDSNPLDYYFWNCVKEKVYEGRMKEPFRNDEELKARIKTVWKKCASNTREIRKALNFETICTAVENRK